MTSFASDILDALYASEINFELRTFWAAGFYWKLGDQMNGYHAEGNAETLLDAVQQLAEATRRHFPLSSFVRAGRGSAGQVGATDSHECRACFEESGRPGPQLPGKKSIPESEFDLLFAARRKCPNCGTDVFLERHIPIGKA